MNKFIFEFENKGILILLIYFIAIVIPTHKTNHRQLHLISYSRPSTMTLKQSKGFNLLHQYGAQMGYKALKTQNGAKDQKTQHSTTIPFLVGPPAPVVYQALKWLLTTASKS